MAQAISQRIQDYFVLSAISDTKFLRASRQIVKSSYFGSEVTQNLVRLCYTYYDQFGEAPATHFRDEVTRYLKNRKAEDAELYMIYLDRLQELDLPNQAYVTSRINSFIQAREFEIGAVELARFAKEGDFEKAKVLMQKMLRSGIISEEVGLKYFDGGYPSYMLERGANEKLIDFGMPPLDRRLSRGLCRTDFLCLLGGYKGKKSFGCVYLGIQGLLKGRKVLHITHELSMEETEKRYDAGLGGLVLDSNVRSDVIKIEIPTEDGEEGEYQDLELSAVGDVNVVKSVRRKVGRLGGELIIRKYPMGQATMGELQRYLDYLEAFEGFVPDIVINDYIEKMRIPMQEKRNDAINDMYLQSKGIADERKLLMITVSQSTRDALRKHKLSQKDFAEDIRKLGNVDMVISISQTDEMAENNRMMAYVMANRSGLQDFGCKFSQNLEIGQFCVKSWNFKTAKTKDRGEGGENK